MAVYRRSRTISEHIVHTLYEAEPDEMTDRTVTQFQDLSNPQSMPGMDDRVYPGASANDEEDGEGEVSSSVHGQDNYGSTAQQEAPSGQKMTPVVKRNVSIAIASGKDSADGEREENGIKHWWYQRMYTNKLFHLITVSFLVLQVLGLFEYNFIMPYYFTVASPVLICIRFYMYFKEKQILFMVDFCYFANIYTLIVIWALPANEVAFILLFALSNGPISWAVIFFKNSLVFHDIDKVTSCFIHTLPSYISFCIRWYPKLTSKYWYANFLNVANLRNASSSVPPASTLPPAFLHIAIPLICYAVHLVCLLVVVHGLVKPPEDYMDSYRYLIVSGKGGVVSKCVNFFGERPRFVMYFLGNMILSTVTISFAMLLYNYFVIHIIFMAVCFLIIHWNGASYYMDIFGRRRFLPNNFFGPLMRRSFSHPAGCKTQEIMTMTDNNKHDPPAPASV